MLLFGQETFPSARCVSAPRRAPSAPPLGAIHPLSVPAVAVAVAGRAAGGYGYESMGDYTGQLQPPAGLSLFGVPPFRPIANQDTAEWKIRDWLKTIPIGNGADRGWDDTQIQEIAAFAKGQRLDHLDAEEIYKRYVEHQVEKATEDAE